MPAALPARQNPPMSADSAPVSLQKQEQIQGPENASIAWFDGLCCYQIHSEKSASARSAGGGETRRTAQA